MRDRLIRVAPDGSLTLPQDILDLLGAQGGGDLVLRVERGSVVLTPAPFDDPGARKERWGPPRSGARVWAQPHDEGEEEG